MAADARPGGRDEGALTDTIFALSSGAPPAGIAVVRISGPGAGAALTDLAGSLPDARVATVKALKDKDEVLDRGLVLWFPGPNSATGEDVAELHLHGGRAIVARVKAALAARQGLREAAPGEFTRRAFENGRIDLAEAEGLGDLLAAETESQRRAALALAGGALSRQVAAWQTELLELAAMVEAALDFSDEDDVSPLPANFHERLDRLHGDISAWLRRPPAERLRDGVRVVVAGPPNAGKSSLFNAIVGREAAIVSAVPGTTRDLIEAPLSLGGVPIILIDTAGLRESDDLIEAEGVGRAQAAAAAADLVLWLGDPPRAPDRAIRVHAKVDLGGASEPGSVAVSALSGQGMDDLIRIIVEAALELLPGESEVALNARQRAALQEAAEAIASATPSDLLLVAESLRIARSAFDRVTGAAGVESVLDGLFGRFCIGK